jgi:hypothetical protein
MVWRSISRAAMFGTLLVMGSISTTVNAAEVTVDELKERLSHAAITDQPGIGIEIAHLQLNAAAKLYTGNEPENASAALSDVAQYCERAGTASINSRSHEKQTEISVRKMIRRLVDMKHAAVQEDQGAIQSAIDRLDRVRDALLKSMFPAHPHK